MCAMSGGNPILYVNDPPAIVIVPREPGAVCAGSMVRGHATETVVLSGRHDHLTPTDQYWFYCSRFVGDKKDGKTAHL